MYSRLRFALCALGLTAGLASCPAVYPELKTPLRSARGELDPPPDGLRWIAFKSATIPAVTRDGRKWDAVGGEAPDPYAVLYVNGKMLIKTPTQANTMAPTWPDGPAGNFWLRDSDKLRVELWDANPIKDHPIGIRDLSSIGMGEEVKTTGVLRVETDTGALVEVAVEPAHAKVGLGLSYEVRLNELFVTKTYPYSPAARAGLRAGDQIMALGGRDVAKMVEGEAQSLLNSAEREGVAIKGKHRDGTEFDIKLTEGAIYPVYAEDGTSLR